MITVDEYLQHSLKYDVDEGSRKIVENYNKNLIEKYPFLMPRNRWTDKVPDSYNYQYTELDAMPEGWRIAFGMDMVKEINDELVKFKFQNDYRIVQIKEKYGGLRWYDNGVPIHSKVHDIIRKYEELSYKTCINCGKPAKYITEGWISPYCEDCINKVRDSYHEICRGDTPEWEIIK